MGLLITALKLSNLRTVKNLLFNNDRDIGINEEDCDGTTALHYLAQKKDEGDITVLRLIELFFQRGGNTEFINKKNKSDKTPLELAIENNNTEVIALLREKSTRTVKEDDTHEYRDLNLNRTDLSTSKELSQKEIDKQNNNHKVKMTIALPEEKNINSTGIQTETIQLNMDVNKNDPSKVEKLSQKTVISEQNNVDEISSDSDTENDKAEMTFLSKEKDSKIANNNTHKSISTDVSVNDPSTSKQSSQEKSAKTVNDLNMLDNSLENNTASSITLDNENGNTEISTNLAEEKSINSTDTQTERAQSYIPTHKNDSNEIEKSLQENNININEQNNDNEASSNLGTKNDNTEHMPLQNSQEADTKIIGKTDTIQQNSQAGNTPLHIAVQKNDLTKVEELLRKSKEDIDQPNNNGETPLDLAIENNKITMINVLLENGAIAAKKENIGNVLMETIELGKDKIVSKLFEIDPDIINWEGTNNLTPLYYIVKTYREQIVKTLIENKDKIVPSEKHKESILNSLKDTSISVSRKKERIQLLINNEIILKEHLLQIIAVFIPSGVYDKEIVESLLNNLPEGAINTRVSDDKTLLDLAIESAPSKDNKTELIDLLLEKGAKTAKEENIHKLLYSNTQSCIIDYFASSINTTKKDIIEEKKRHIKKLLLLNKQNASNSKNSEGLTILQSIIVGLYTANKEVVKEIAEILLNHGADPNVKDKTTGFTLLHLAVKNGNKALVALLLKYKANLNILDNEGKTPLDLAKEQAKETGNNNILNLLEDAIKDEQNKKNQSSKAPQVNASMQDNQKSSLNCTKKEDKVKEKSNFVKELPKNANKKTKQLILVVKVALTFSIIVAGVIGVTNPENFMGTSNTELRLGLSITAIVVGALALVICSCYKKSTSKVIQQTDEKIYENTSVDTNISDSYITEADNKAHQFK